MSAHPSAHDPDADKLATSCFDLLLIELVPLAQRIVADLHAKEALLIRQSQHLSLSSTTTTTTNYTSPTYVKKNTSTAATTTTPGANNGPDRTSVLSSNGGDAESIGTSKAAMGSLGGGGAETFTGTGLGIGHGIGDGMGGGAEGGGGAQDDEEAREAVFHRLDALGYRVGQGLVERFSAQSPRPNAPLDMIKFLCKDLWTLVFRKQIDNLKTNHRGTFVLTDSRFPPLSRMSVDRGRGARGLEEALGRAQAFLWFPCGIIRGALSGFGLNVTVQAETSDLKSAVFQIRTVGSKP
ncbi:hypothetical protein AAFC00_002872 [Neodothiora populina]|uniref:Transport protein particle component n=1 Tax=Neodothiora populina TaxID=2781224 RepID=A0ABR3P9V2_9PEZI